MLLPLPHDGVDLCALLLRMSALPARRLLGLLVLGRRTMAADSRAVRPITITAAATATATAAAADAAQLRGERAWVRDAPGLTPTLTLTPTLIPT